MNRDGVSLFSTAHPKGSRWKSAWLWVLNRLGRDLHPGSLELVTLEVLERDRPANREAQERRAANIFNRTFIPRALEPKYEWKAMSEWLAENAPSQGENQTKTIADDGWELVGGALRRPVK